jgi:glycosyltransferase involved in cell wall biosynthesis
MPEVAGQAALLVNPNKLSELKNAMHEVYRDEQLRAALIKKGFEQAAEFSWKKTAGQFLANLEEGKS